MELRVVLIDDNLTFLTSAKRYLEMLPDLRVCDLQVAGGDVMRHIQEEKPDLVLLDLAFDDADHMHLARDLAGLERPPKIVFLSFHERGDAALHLFGFKEATFVHKADFVVEILPIIDGLRAIVPASRRL